MSRFKYVAISCFYAGGVIDFWYTGCCQLKILGCLFGQSKPLVVVAPGTIGTGIIGGIVTGTIGGIVPGTIGINPSGTKSTRKRKKTSEYGIKRSGVN
jgi:hypothetical protein